MGGRVGAINRWMVNGDGNEWAGSGRLVARPLPAPSCALAAGRAFRPCAPAQRFLRRYALQRFRPIN